MGCSNRGSGQIGPEPAVDEAPLLRPRPVVDPDAELVERLRRRDAGAAEALVASYGDRVYRLAIRLTGNSSDAEEVVRDALWAATREIDGFPGTAAFETWVYRITTNAAHQKRQGRLVERNATSWEDLALSFDQTRQHVQPGLDWSPRLNDPALQAELQSVLRAAIEELSEDHRAAFRLHDVEGLSNPEIAEVLQTKPATVKARVHRARLFLRSRLADYVGVGTELN